MSTKSVINHRMNSFKGLACILVVFIHARFPSVVGEMVLAIARAAVPFFFMVSGYFSYRVDDCKMKSVIPRKAKHIAIIAAWACLYNFACMILVETVSGTDMLVWLQETFRLRDIYLWIVWNNAIPGIHLWFLFALLYCYGAFYLLIKMHSVKVGYILIPLLLIICWIQGSFQIVTLGLPNKLVPVLSRNWIFVGLPFFLLGNFLASKKDKILHNKKYVRLPYIFCLISVLESMIEAIVFNNQSEICIFTPLLAASCFVMAIQRPEISNPFGKMLEKLGDRYSLFIYVIHWSIFKGLNVVLRLCGLNENLIVEWIEPFAVIAGSLCIAVIVAKIQTFLFKRKIVLR